jgi:ribosomal protein L22
MRPFFIYNASISERLLSCLRRQKTLFSHVSHVRIYFANSTPNWASRIHEQIINPIVRVHGFSSILKANAFFNFQQNRNASPRLSRVANDACRWQATSSREIAPLISSARASANRTLKIECSRLFIRTLDGLRAVGERGGRREATRRATPSTR